MSIDQLLYFIRVYETGSYTETSKEMFVSQPAVTTGIKNLEKELKTVLFAKNGRGFHPTPSGEYLYQIAKPVVTLYNNLGDQMKDFKYKSTTIRIGIPPMLGSFIFAPIFDAFLTKYPNINIKMYELASKANKEAIKNGEIDIALTVRYKDEELDPSLEYIKVDETKLLFSVNKKHPLASKEKISLDDIKDLPLITLKEDSLQYKVVNELFLSKKLNPNIRLKTDQLATIKELLSYGKIGAFLFNQVIKKDDDIVGIPLEDDVTFDIIVATNKNIILNKPAIELLQFIKDYKNFH